MKHIFIITALCGLLFASACSKKSASNRASFTWTYAGATFTADTVLATKADSVAGTLYPPQIYAQTGPWSTPQIAFTANISSLAQGSYGDIGQNSFSEYVQYTGNSWIDPFTITITSSSNNMISGNFTGTLGNQTISGTFANVVVH